MTADLKTVRPRTIVGGSLTVPGDKSMSQRVAMLAGLAEGESELRGFLRSEDCLNALSAVCALGATAEDDGDTIRITGTGGRFRDPCTVLDMGNSGTGMRLLSGLLAGQNFESELTGDASLLSRPMERIKAPLEAMGASVTLLGEGGRGPVRIRGGALRGCEHRQQIASAQVKSCILFAGLYAQGETVVIEPGPSRDHTERLLADLGCEISVEGSEIRLRSPAGYPRFPGRVFDVPGDVSSAAFWMVAAAIAEPGTQTEIKHVGLNPRRAGVVDVLRRMGASIEVDLLSTGQEPFGDLRVTAQPLQATEIGGVEIPVILDELPVLAVAAAYADGQTVIRDAAELRVKESDRIAAMVESLVAAGVDAEAADDGMRISGGHVRGGCTVQSRGDHRVAMSMAILALRAEASVQIEGTSCIATSYPEFWEHLECIAPEAGGDS